MNLNELEKCPKCGSRMVYCGHEYPDNTYDIHCIKCGLSTTKHDTYKKACKEWKEIKDGFTRRTGNSHSVQQN